MKPTHTAESADNFLSHHGNIGSGIDYSGRGLKGTAVEIVEHLKTLALASQSEPYTTEGFHAVTGNPIDNPNANSLEWTNKRRDAQKAYEDVLATGDVKKVHAAVDKLNKIQAIMGGKAAVAASDFDIIAHQQTPLGEAARFIKNERVRYAEVQAANPEENDQIAAMRGSVIPWFDTPEAFKALAAF